jgi:nicotinate-nucleotide adenylyltransferase
MRIGVFGGTFDPIHWGHLVLAEQCREQCRLDRVLFIPAAVPPHKPPKALTPGRHRLEMIRLAIAGHLCFEASPVELDRGGVSYTVETLEQLRAAHPEAELFLILGADSLQDFPFWREPDRILELASLACAQRPDAEVQLRGPSRPLLERIHQRLHWVQMPLIGISASEIRARVQAGRSIRYLVPRAVECYIQDHGLYRLPGP